MGGPVCWSPQKSVYAVGYSAGVDLTADGIKGKAVIFDAAADKVILAPTGSAAIGLLQDPCKLGGHPDVIAAGGAFGRLGATVKRGQYLKVGSAGRLVPCTSIGDNYIARASFDGVNNGLIGVIVVHGQYGGAGNSGVSALVAAGAGVSVAPKAGPQTFTFELVDAVVPMVDNAGVVAYGSLKIADFAQGAVQFLGATSNLAVTKSSAGIDAAFDGDFALGTVAANNGATLATTEQNVIPTTAMPQAVAGATTAKGQSTAVSAVIDGTTTPVALYINALVDDTDHDVTTTPANLILNGTVTVTFINYGDY